ncbi:MAG TPA: hypothetical protein VL551_10510 [Actinospica sp.]|jgi:predicted GH43/DUF377 family glycosyl hydrolase|nr:hypothetical protein [Actinospica sp.]
MRALYKRVILEPSDSDHDCRGAFNPACVRDDEGIHVVYRASDSQLNATLGYARLDLGHNILERATQPLLSPSTDYDRLGIEDPKLIPWGRGTLLLYHAVGTDEHWVGVGTAAAYTQDFRSFRKLGLVRPFVPFHKILAKVPSTFHPTLRRLCDEYSKQPAVQTLWGKDLVLFPRKFDGRDLAIYRVPPAISIAPLDDLLADPVFWQSECFDQRRLLLSPMHWFESRSISPSAPPILTSHGWLLIFHCVDTGTDGNARYTASAALLDRENPSRVLGRLTEPLLEPEHDWERQGTTGTCVYVSAVDVIDDTVYVYYGAADVRSAVAAFDLGAVIAAMG